MRLPAAGRLGPALPAMLAIALALLEPARAAGSETAREFECRLADLVRKIEVSRVIPERPLPCQVVYRKPVEEPGVSRVLWDAANDSGYCERKARELAAKLEAGGWACTAPPPIGDGAIGRPRDAAGAPALEPALEQAVRRDLERLKTPGGKPVRADVAARGDLDGDGDQDAVALITFDPDGPNRAQYLVAYLVTGGEFRSTASRFVGGRFREVYDGEVEGIENGAIMLNLRTFQPDDASCCPSGSRRATFVLRNGELVRAE